MANPGPAQAGIPNTELYVSNGPMSRVIYPVGFTLGGAIGNGTLSFQYYNCTYPVSASRLDCLLEMSQATAATTATAARFVSICPLDSCLPTCISMTQTLASL